MNIVTTTSVFPPCYHAEKALTRLHNCGFSHLDLAFDYLVQECDFPFVTDAWENWAKRLGEHSERLGVRYTHAHANGNAACRSVPMLRSFKVCRILGIPYMVVHPLFRDADGKNIDSIDAFVEVNAAAVKPLLEIAEENNVTILSENLLWGASIQPAAIDALVEAVNSPYFGWCYDTGHAHAFGIEANALIGLKHVPLSLHMQDNHGKGGDEHLLPGDGTIDWSQFLRVLVEIGYKGDIVLEAHHQSLDARDEDREAILCELYRRAEKMKAELVALQNNH
ncbi:MAG: sugar phosphate isomerase/epimerase [Clostridia bacterium]|nr:sugar phosphate isomerase/epimerase [Clostridia bacterium]